ncbi:MAG: hypothetical protein U9R02_06765, partial [Thermodesulfobacteriota bacterium]|nr:hypothetical protein [Thermodesulfobacteriota bacterium]
ETYIKWQNSFLRHSLFPVRHSIFKKSYTFNVLYLITFLYCTPFEESQLYENISMTMIKDDISERIPAKRIFYVMDSCYSGLLVSKRGATRKTARDFSYLQEITKEEACQALTAGSKDQQVLDGGPRGALCIYRQIYRGTGKYR